LVTRQGCSSTELGNPCDDVEPGKKDADAADVGAMLEIEAEQEY